jgi:hypothetical protein
VGGRQRKKRHSLGFLRAESRTTWRQPQSARDETRARDAGDYEIVECYGWNQKGLYAITPFTIQPGDHDDINDE